MDQLLQLQQMMRQASSGYPQLSPGVGPAFSGPPRGGRGPGGRSGMPHRKQCNCKNSRCLKLYCECFASGRYCEGCNCTNCCNKHEHEHTRQSAVEAILERNPNAFRPKIQTTDTELLSATIGRAALGPDGVGKHAKGCNCKKSACLKKYCECFQAGVFCSHTCKCIECKNYEGSEQRSHVVACLNSQPGGLGAENTSGTSPIKRYRSGQGLTLPDRSTVPTPVPQPMLHQVVGEVVKVGVVEELCRLLFLVANEEADRQSAAAAASKPFAEGSWPESGPDKDHGGRGGTVGSGVPAGEGVDPRPGAPFATDTVVAGQGVQELQGSSGDKQQVLTSPSLQSMWDAQERAILEEFITMFRKMTSAIHKRVETQQQQKLAELTMAATHAASMAGGPNALGGVGGLMNGAAMSQQLMTAAMLAMSRPGYPFNPNFNASFNPSFSANSNPLSSPTLAPAYSGPGLQAPPLNPNTLSSLTHLANQLAAANGITSLGSLGIGTLLPPGSWGGGGGSDAEVPPSLHTYGSYPIHSLHPSHQGEPGADHEGSSAMAGAGSLDEDSGEGQPQSPSAEGTAQGVGRGEFLPASWPSAGSEPMQVTSDTVLLHLRRSHIQHADGKGYKRSKHDRL